jgi:hypothetical protein
MVAPTAESTNVVSVSHPIPRVIAALVTVLMLKKLLLTTLIPRGSAFWNAKNAIDDK